MQGYRGRFAPTPSGPLHLGSLLAALASYLQARRHGGQWFLRIDDLDRTRCPPGADQRIQEQLRAHGLQWDGAPRYQSAHREEYQAALDRLQAGGHLYACDCTRAELARSRLPGPDDPVYPGRCRDRALPGAGRHSLRLQVPPGTACLDDARLGRVCRDLPLEVGDFIVRRADRQIAYQLACAVDEHALGITEVVRGLDLLGSTFQQRCVMQALGLPAPGYLHLPLLVGERGAKLSKQNHAVPLRDADAAGNLRRCLAWLGQPPPPATTTRADPLLAWATAHWDAGRIPARDAIPTG